MEKGYIHVYTGNGKGKTTAAMGLALRAMGNQLRTYIGQFMKGMHYGELSAAKLCAPWITIEQYGSDKFTCLGEVDPQEVQKAQAGLAKIQAAMSSGDYRIVVLDEVNTALFFKLLQIEEVLAVLQQKPLAVELVLTGRNAPQAIIDAAHLVTEMREIKHYYTQGVQARIGIEM